MRTFFCWCLGVGILIACGSEGDSTFMDPNGSSTSGGSSGILGGGDAGAIDSGDGDDVPATDVAAVVTTDNAFSFGYGGANGLNTFIRGEGSDGKMIFDCPVGYGPTAYVVPAAQAPSSAYLYIIAWADTEVTQGALAQFKRVGGKAIYSGDLKFEVCAVGRFYEDLGPGPTQDDVNKDIGECNKGAPGATYSKGWVNKDGALTAGAIGKLAIGETNEDPGGDFPVVCQKDDAGVDGIDAVAKWMWFDPLDGKDPFMGNDGNRTKTYLLFRLPATALPPSGVK